VRPYRISVIEDRPTGIALVFATVNDSPSRPPIAVDRSAGRAFRPAVRDRPGRALRPPDETFGVSDDRFTLEPQPTRFRRLHFNGVLAAPESGSATPPLPNQNPEQKIRMSLDFKWRGRLNSFRGHRP
jgi:hypothetical protein